jgi:pimeloyl-ACP methyl ester carboxylesterase
VTLTRWLKRALLACVVLLSFVSICGALYQWLATRRDLAAHPAPGHLVDIGGHRLHIWCTGSGTPAVILDSGLGGSFVDWSYVQPDIARFTTVCSYDRAGMGYSDPGPFPRTSQQIADELAVLLDRAHIPGPVVLAGASLGGFNVRVLASTRPERVAGLVLVDASHETQSAEIPGIARFVPVFSTLGIFRIADITFGQRPN